VHSDALLRTIPHVGDQTRTDQTRQQNGVTPMARKGLTQEQAYAMCHGMGHSWRHAKAVAVDSTTRGSERAPHGMMCLAYPSTCDVCGTERMRWVTRRGESLPPRYDWPDGYSRRGEDRMTTTEWRRSFVERDYAALDQRLSRQAERGAA
jgi:hypothetical protein